MRALLIVPSVLLAFAACTRAPVDAASGSPDAAGCVGEAGIASPYSPFGVRVDGHGAFRFISFKHAGAEPLDPDDPVFEALAESVALELRSGVEALTTEVVHAPELRDPHNHTFCAGSHLYVDFWRSPGPARWGYSLWSGCGDDDRFAWREVQASIAPDALLNALSRVSRDLASTLSRADAAGCYQRRC